MSTAVEFGVRTRIRGVNRLETTSGKRQSLRCTASLGAEISEIEKEGRRSTDGEGRKKVNRVARTKGFEPDGSVCSDSRLNRQPGEV